MFEKEMVGEPSRLVIVLGMHRSGTSVLARCLHVLGVELGERMMPASQFNARGFWEDLDVVALNERVLGTMSRTWRSPALIDDSHWRLATLNPLASAAEQLVRARLERYPVWGFKDPRLCLLLPFWQPVFRRLGLRESYLIALRDPRAVADSLRARDRIAPDLSHLLWLIHLHGALRDSAGKPRVLVDYDEMLRKPREQICRIAKALEFEQPATDDPGMLNFEREFLTSELRHHVYARKSRADSPIAAVAERTFYSLREIALAKGDNTENKLTAIQHDLGSLIDELSPILALIDHLDRQVQSREEELFAAREWLERSRIRGQVPRTSGESQPGDIGVREALLKQSIGVYHPLLDEIRRLWNSRSWRLLRPVRNLHRRLNGQGEEREPAPLFELDALQTLTTIRESLSWELTSPLRIVDRITSRIRARMLPRRTPPASECVPVRNSDIVRE